MQHRMREWPMDEGAIRDFLTACPVGRISTVGEDGWPYTVAVHYVYRDGRICFHGLNAGEKLDNLRRCDKVCFEVDVLDGVLSQGIASPCDADAAYRSVVLRGRARLVEDLNEKRAILAAIVEKYLPEGQALPMEDRLVAGTAVVEITPCRLTGKYHQ